MHAFDLVTRPINSDLVAQAWLRQARGRRAAHFSATNGADEAWRKQDGQMGRDFSDGTPAQRVSDFAARVISLCEALPSRTGAGRLCVQFPCSAASVAADCAEASAPDSREDFAPRTNGALKELVETRRRLRIISKGKYVNSDLPAPLPGEIGDPLGIFGTRDRTTRKILAESRNWFV